METMETTIENNIKNKVATDINNTLVHFTGTEEYHRFSRISRLVMTDGVKYLCNAAGAFWLLDIIVSYQGKCNRDPMLKDFQIWTLKVKGSKGVVTCERDTDDVAIKQAIPYTDFPLESIKLYCENGVICLPSER